MTDWSPPGVPRDTGYGIFCPCGSEMFGNVCERGHVWQAKLEEYEFYPYGPKYKAHRGERVVWTMAEEVKA